MRNGHAPRARRADETASAGAAQRGSRSVPRGGNETTPFRSFDDMHFLSYDLALDIIRGLQPSLAIVRKHDAALAKQATTASQACC